MDFFESQDVARRNTGRLVMLFAVAVLATMVMAYLVVAGSILFFEQQQAARNNVLRTARPPSNLLAPGLLAAVGLGTLTVVGGGGLYKLAQLRAGGRVVAQSLGGRLVHADSADATDRRVLNVVEEMAIASGTPVPPVYMMDDEASINAFAAGFSPSDAVVGVTRGCAERLSRNQLQGVMAHEFGHILSGDMRLNIRLIAVLHGLLMIGLIGYFLFRMAFWSGAGRRSSRDRNNPLPLLAIGGGLMAVGFIGSFFGNWIKAAVSRQREFLADASAVQFTRDPQGIGGALKSIGGLAAGSHIDNPHAPEASHMFFGRALTKGLHGLFATHPPLAERIKRIEPSWDGGFAHLPSEPAKEQDRPGKSRAAGAMGLAGEVPAPAQAAAPPTTPSAIDSIGQLDQAHLAYAAGLIGRLPAPVVAAVHETYGARAVIYALLINKDKQARQVQLQRLAEHAHCGVYDLTLKLLGPIERVDEHARLPLIDLALPALRELTADQYAAFRQNVAELAAADRKIDLFEWSLQRMLLRHLDPHFGQTRRTRAHYYALRPVQAQCEVLLSALAYVGHAGGDGAADAFRQGAGRLELADMSMRNAKQCRLDVVGEALDELAKLAPRFKKRLITACAVCVAADHEVTVHEAELLRAICDTLDCPMPPLLAGQRLV